MTSGLPRQFFVAYARSPDARCFADDRGSAAFSDAQRQALADMRAAAEAIRVVYRMQVVDDRWRDAAEHHSG